MCRNRSIIFCWISFHMRRIRFLHAEDSLFKLRKQKRETFVWET